MMTRVKRQPLKIALALSTALTLAGCSGGGVGDDTGVSVEGSDYSVAELQEATAQLNRVAQQPSDPQQVVADLALLPLLDDIFAGSPRELTDGSVREVLGQGGVSDPNPATLDAARSRQYQAALSDPALQADPAMADAMSRAMAVTEEDLAAVDVDVNPRYGTWDVTQGGLGPATPAWIQSDASEDS
jgi:hypothetical protein